MKKIVFPIFCVLFLVVSIWGWSTQSVAINALKANEIYVFTQKTCPHCQAAEKYLKETYPDLKVQIKDIAQPQNRLMFFACAAKFKLNKNIVGTPLFCMGDDYILGWSFDEQQKFDECVQKFLSKK